MMIVTKKRCFRAGDVSMGSMTAALYHMLNALPRTCGTTGASAVNSSPYRSRARVIFSAGSMVENNRAELSGRDLPVRNRDVPARNRQAARIEIQRPKADSNG